MAQTSNMHEWFTPLHQTTGQLIERIALLAKRESVRGKEYESILEKIKACRTCWREMSFQVAVLAPIKAGKTTFINALLGDEFFPSLILPEAAGSIRVRHNSTEKQGILTEDGRILAAGASNVYRYMLKLGEQVLKEHLVSHSENKLVLEASLISLIDQPPGMPRFELLDTSPLGYSVPLMAAQSHHSIASILSESYAIIYIFDYSRLKFTDEHYLLEWLSKTRSDILKNAWERLFFVVNKVDMRRSDGPTREVLLDYVSRLVQRYLGQGAATERIFPISANDALLSRLILSNRASPEALDFFLQRAFGPMRDDGSVGEEKLRQIAQLFLERSNIEEFEKAVLSFLYSQREYLLLGALLDDLRYILNYLFDDFHILYNISQSSPISLETKIKEIEYDLTELEKRLDQMTVTSKQPDSRDLVFISYSHKDRKWLNELLTILSPVIREEKIKIWEDTQIKAGDDWRKQVGDALATAKAAILLVTPNFLASDFIAEHEIPPLLEEAKKNGLVILWIAVRHCLYQETPIAKYQAVNTPSKPLESFRSADRNREWIFIWDKIKQAISK